MRERSVRLVEESISEENYSDRNRFSSYTVAEIDQIEEKDLRGFLSEHVGNAEIDLTCLVDLIFSHLLVSRNRSINHTGLKFDEVLLHGPSPLLYFDQ